MPVTTSGQLNVTPVMLKTDLTLPELRDSMEKNPYRKVGDAGWGAITEFTDSLLGETQVERSAPGSPRIVSATDFWPETLEARLYWDEIDRGLFKAANQSGASIDVLRFQAADIVINLDKSDGTVHTYQVLITTQNELQVDNFVLKSLRKVCEKGQICEFIRDDVELAIAEDFFRWALEKISNNAAVTGDLKLIKIDSIQCFDRNYRGSLLSEGATLDRLELLALIAEGSNSFGPAKIQMWFDPLSLDLTAELSPSGRFKVIRGASRYESSKPAEEFPNEGLDMLKDLAYVLLPELQSAFNADKNWVAKGRSQFRHAMKSQLLALAAKL